MFFLAIVSMFGSSFSMEIPNYEWYVTDKIGLLNKQEKLDLENTISDIEKKTSAEISVLLVKTVDWDDINLVANEIWNKWWVGKTIDNWIIILVAMDDRQWSIQVWYWLEWTIPDIIAKRIWENRLTSNFKNGKYYIGIKEAVQDISSYIQKDETVLWMYEKENKSIWNYFNEGSLIIAIFLSFVLSNFIVKKEWDKKIINRTWWIKLGAFWFVIWVLFALFAASLVWIFLSFIISYVFLILWVLLNIYWKSINWTWSGFWRWKSGWISWWFGWFGGGSFGGGWASGKW